MNKTNWIDVNERLPEPKDGWDHSEQVLVHYNGIPNEKVEGYGISYFHYNPPFQESPRFIDFNDSREPTHWMPIPPIENSTDG